MANVARMVTLFDDEHQALMATLRSVQCAGWTIGEGAGSLTKSRRSRYSGCPPCRKSACENVNCSDVVSRCADHHPRPRE
jgi:hypothetical protein